MIQAILTDEEIRLRNCVELGFEGLQKQRAVPSVRSEPRGDGVLPSPSNSRSEGEQPPRQPNVSMPKTPYYCSSDWA